MVSTLLQSDVLVRAEALGMKARDVVEGLRVGDHKSPYRGFSVEFVQNREYVPGDDIKHIDWKSYARSDRYTIKQYEQETNFIAHLLVDGSNSMRYGSQETNKLEYAKFLAAALSYLVIKQRDSVSLRLFDQEWRTVLPASSQMGHLQSICTTLEMSQAARKTVMKPLLEQLADQVTRRGIIFLISDCFAQVAELLQGLRQLRFRGHEVIVFHVLHADELDFNIEGNVRFLDLEGPEQLLARPHLLKPSYLRALQRYLDELRVGCEGSRIDYVLTRTDRSLASFLADYLGRRQNLAAAKRR